MHQALLPIFTKRYNTIKTQFPNEGRRRWCLRVLEEFWESVLTDEKLTTLGDIAIPSDDVNMEEDDDPFDRFSEGREFGLLLRTDFSNEEAWQSFCNQLEDNEKQLAEAIKADETPQTDSSRPEIIDSDDEDSMEGVPFPIIKILILDSSSPMMAMFNNISNLTALRLFNDVDIRPAPSPAAGQNRINTPNRLVDQAKWQEVYSGINIWIYDALSNTDKCVRLVHQEGDVYGTATGDSWRVQGTHICEIQFNMVCLGMKINFGGLDRWDYNERQRNLEQVGRGIE